MCIVHHAILKLILHPQQSCEVLLLFLFSPVSTARLVSPREAEFASGPAPFPGFSSPTRDPPLPPGVRLQGVQESETLMSAPGEEVGCLLARCREVITVVTSMASSHGDLRQPLPENVTCDVKEVYPQQSGQGRQLADCWVQHRQGNREIRKRGSDL